MKERIDFDAQFNAYMEEWADKLLEQGKKAEEIEDMIPEAYEAWAKESEKYFDGMTGCELTDMLGAYLDECISVPDILLEKIKEQPACADDVYELFCQERTEDDKILLMNLMAEMGCLRPLRDYIAIVCRGEEGEMTEAATEALRYAGLDAVQAVQEVLEDETDPYIQERLLYVLVYAEPTVPGLAKPLCALMACTDHKAIVAGMMAFYGDDVCLPALKQAEQDPYISYIDYVEICDAIESLGGETDRKREFDGDDYYEMVQNGELDT